MDGRSMAFLQKQAHKAVTDCFASGITRDNLLQAAAIELEFHGAIDASLREASPPERVIACAKGCAACCHQRVLCSIPQAISIALDLQMRGADEVATIARDARTLHDKTLALDAYGRLRSGLPCPLLRDDACSIYETRPPACRSLYSFDRAACERYYRAFAFDKPPPNYPIMLDALGQMLLGFGRALDALGLDGGLVELGSALAMILEDPGVIDRYLAGERLFAAARPRPD
jgi:Fe-S-cluster containining protein